jgi:hypothetical protein
MLFRSRNDPTNRPQLQVGQGNDMKNGRINPSESMEVSVNAIPLPQTACYIFQEQGEPGRQPREGTGPIPPTIIEHAGGARTPCHRTSIKLATHTKTASKGPFFFFLRPSQDVEAEGREGRKEGRVPFGCGKTWSGEPNRSGGWPLQGGRNKKEY